MTLVFERLKTKLMKTNIFFGFITKTKQMALVFDWLKTKRIKTKEISPLSTTRLSYYNVTTRLSDLVWLCWLK